MEKLTLYTYCKSSAAYRVRIALNLKNIAYEPVYISLLNEKSENYDPQYLNINPQAMVPTLVTESGTLTQSTAIIEYLEERYRELPLLPADLQARALARSYAQMIACDIHPLNNLRVLDYLRKNLHAEEQQVMIWYKHWIQEGFQALETRLHSSGLTGYYCLGDEPGMADIYLAPQVYNAYRFQCDMKNFPIIDRIYHGCLELTAFQNASPEHQTDYQP